MALFLVLALPDRRRMTEPIAFPAQVPEVLAREAK
jgi:hypothetical protein